MTYDQWKHRDQQGEEDDQRVYICPECSRASHDDCSGVKFSSEAHARECECDCHSASPEDLTDWRNEEPLDTDEDSEVNRK